MEKYYRWMKSNWTLILIVSYIFFILYVTIVPFSFIFDFEFLKYRLHQIDFVPFIEDGLLYDRSDIVGNIIFFFPFGFLLGLRKILKNFRAFTFLEWIKITATGALVSFCVEFLQIFTYNRFPSVSDIITNSMGTVLGALFILVVYLRFHRQIKFFLFKFFAGKPEMILAGLLVIFIFISQSAPFTFRLSIYLVGQGFRELIGDPFSLTFVPGAFLASVLVYGSLSYFLLAGLRRYFRRELTARLYGLAAATLFLLPAIMEIYQLLLPTRFHSISDILQGEIGLAAGAVIFWYQFRTRRSGFETAAEEASCYYRREIRFFEVMGIFYLLFLAERYLFPFQPVLSFHSLPVLMLEDWRNLYDFIRQQRLEFLVILVKEVFAFLPAGFIISLMWKYHRKLQISGIAIGLLSFFIPLSFYIISFLFTRQHMHLAEIPAAMLGIWLGHICWQIYEFMIGPFSP